MIKVRLGDVDPSGRMRLDAMARYLQDVSGDDSPNDPLTWVVRRVTLRIDAWPRLGQSLESKTWCSGVGQRWAERSTTLGPIRATALWVNVDPKTLLPARLPLEFIEKRCPDAPKISGRLRHSGPPADVEWRPWPVRATDLDILDHMNNAAYWHAVEEVLPDLRTMTEAEIEYRVPVNRGQTVFVGGADGRLWLRGEDGSVFASVVLL
jgi:acyl-ACP thioesterase